MRRNESEITDTKLIEQIISSADIIRIGLIDGKEPYIVPLNFGYKAPYFYMHSAIEGRKIDIIKKNPVACFELDTNHKLKKAPKACGWSMTFNCVMGVGKIEIIDDITEKKNGLTILMDQYNPDEIARPYDFSKLIDKTTVLRLKVKDLSCKVKE